MSSALQGSLMVDVAGTWLTAEDRQLLRLGGQAGGSTEQDGGEGSDHDRSARMSTFARGVPAQQGVMVAR